MKVSRPQQRIYPVEKCGRPAESVDVGLVGFGLGRLGLGFGKSAEFETAVHCTEPRAKSLMNALPFVINLSD